MLRTGRSRWPEYATAPPAVGEPMRVEHEYERKGAWAYFAAWDVRRAKIYGRCEQKTGIAGFNRLVSQVMSQEPYRSAPRVFWVVDNGSSHDRPRFVGQSEGSLATLSNPLRGGGEAVPVEVHPPGPGEADEEARSP